jgi:hypothetical protein
MSIIGIVNNSVVVTAPGKKHSHRVADHVNVALSMTRAERTVHFKTVLDHPDDRS